MVKLKFCFHKGPHEPWQCWRMLGCPPDRVMQGQGEGICPCGYGRLCRHWEHEESVPGARVRVTGTLRSRRAEAHPSQEGRSVIGRGGMWLVLQGLQMPDGLLGP